MIAAALIGVQKNGDKRTGIATRSRNNVKNIATCRFPSWLHMQIDTRGGDGTQRRNANRVIFGDIRRAARVLREDAPRLRRVDDTRGTTQNKHGLGRPREMTRVRSASIPRLPDRNESRRFERDNGRDVSAAIYIRSRRINPRISGVKTSRRAQRKKSRFATHGHPVGVFPSDLLALGLPLFERMLLFILELHCPR